MSRQYILVYNLDRCTGCKACSVACHNEHDMPPGVNFCQVERIGPTGKYPDLKMSFFPRTCMHCSNPPCREVCPEGAIRISDHGIVCFDEGACTDCKACIEACPYKAIHYNQERRIAQKCNMCRHLIDNGESLPNCVAHCPGLAIYFGDRNDPSSTVARILSAHKSVVFRHREELKTEPNVYYIPVIDRSPV